jgi:hypothetical protein
MTKEPYFLLFGRYLSCFVLLFHKNPLLRVVSYRAWRADIWINYFYDASRCYIELYREGRRYKTYFWPSTLKPKYYFNCVYTETMTRQLTKVFFITYMFNKDFLYSFIFKSLKCKSPAKIKWSTFLNLFFESLSCAF